MPLYVPPVCPCMCQEPLYAPVCSLLYAPVGKFVSALFLSVAGGCTGKPCVFTQAYGVRMGTVGSVVQTRATGGCTCFFSPFLWQRPVCPCRPLYVAYRGIQGHTGAQVCPCMPPYAPVCPMAASSDCAIFKHGFYAVHNETYFSMCWWFVSRGS